MADRAAQRLSLLPMFQEKEAAGGSSRGWTHHTGWLGRLCSASSCLLPSCTMLGKALWEIWQLFLNRLEITWCSSPGGPGKHFTEPLGPAQKGHSHTAFVSGFGAGSSLPSLENRQREQVILQKGEKKSKQSGKFLQECLKPGRYFEVTQKQLIHIQLLYDQKPDCSCRHKEIKPPVPFISVWALQRRSCVGVHILTFLQNTHSLSNSLPAPPILGVMTQLHSNQTGWRCLEL